MISFYLQCIILEESYIPPLFYLGVAAFHLVVTSETIEWTVTVLVEALVGDSTVTVALTEDQTETETDMPGDTESCSLLMTIV